MFLYDKTNILEGSGIFEVDFAPSHGPASAATSLLMAQPLYCHHPITNHHVPDSHRRLGPGRMTSEVET